MNIYLTGTAWVVAAAIVAGAVTYSVRRFTEHEGRADNNEAAGQVFTIVGGLYAVLLAFVLIGLFDAVGAAQTTAYQEANGLVALSWAGDSLPEPARTQIHTLAEGYARTVINTEWPEMAAGDTVSDSAWSTLVQLRQAIAAANTTSDWQNSQKAAAAEQLLTVYQNRQQRLNDAGSGVSAVIWLALAAGAVLSLALPLLFGGPKIRAHILIVSTLSATLALLIFAIYQLQNPFAGGAAIGPDAFQSALDRLQ